MQPAGVPSAFLWPGPPSHTGRVFKPDKEADHAVYQP
jgi:hypothetical protein